MTKTIILTLLIAGVFIAGSFAINEADAASVDYFLKIDGVEGESGASGHEDEIDIESWSWGETNESTSIPGGGKGTGKVSIQDMSFVMKVNKASAKLMEACASGTHFKDAVLTVRKAGGDAGRAHLDYLVITMKDIIVSSYQIEGSSGDDDVPVDQVSLNFGEIKVSYQPQNAEGDPDGPIITGSASKHGRK